MAHAANQLFLMMGSFFDDGAVVDGGAGSNTAGQPDIAADGGSLSNHGVPTQDGGTGIDGDVVFQCGVSLDGLLHIMWHVWAQGQRPQCDALIQFDIVSDNGCCTNNNARSVVHEEPLADGRAGVDVDAGLGVGMLGEDAWDHGHPQCKEHMGNAVGHQRPNPRIGKHDFFDAARGRVMDVGGLNIPGELVPDGGQLVQQMAHALAAPAGMATLGSGLVAILPCAGTLDLLAEQRCSRLKVFIEGFAEVVWRQVLGAEKAQKKHVLKVRKGLDDRPSIGQDACLKTVDDQRAGIALGELVKDALEAFRAQRMVHDGLNRGGQHAPHIESLL